MLTIGTKVKIKDSYEPYKSVRGLTGEIVWACGFGLNGQMRYQIILDKTPARHKHITSCFAGENELEVL